MNYMGYQTASLKIVAANNVTDVTPQLRYILISVLLAAIITFALRALPFLIFHGERKMPAFLVKLGSVLPAAIMAVLIVYCVKDAVTDWRNSAIPQLLAVLATGVSYKWKHNTLLSIILGTVVYMLLIRCRIF